MNKEKFKIIQYIREFIVYIENGMENFPKKDIEIKNKIKMASYELLEISYEANTTQNIKYKKELLVKCIAKIKIIDFLINLSYDKQIINKNKYLKFANKLDGIVKYITGWLKSMDISHNNIETETVESVTDK